MVITMTNRLLAIVMAFALSSGIIAHAAQDESLKPPVVPLPQMSLSDRLATSLPASIATDVMEEASAAIDNRGPVRDAYVRDQVALEHLRQSGSKLSCSTRQTFNTLVSNDEAALVDIERNALAANDPLSTSVDEMDNVVASANNTLAKDQTTCQRWTETERETQGSGTHSSTTPSPSPSASPRPIDE